LIALSLSCTARDTKPKGSWFGSESNHSANASINGENSNDMNSEINNSGNLGDNSGNMGDHSGNASDSENKGVKNTGSSSLHLDTCYLGGGCFWCLDAVYRNLKGVEKVICGYSNGLVARPTYREVCTGRTQCVEVVKIVFNTQETSFQEILTVFWRIHDPTTLNRQGNDVGTQYRSGIYYTDDNQKKLAELSRDAAQESGLWKDKIVTEIVPITKYSDAEDYHQNYFENNPNQPYCVYVVGEKVEKFKKLFKEKLKKN
jgi:methionine-S-sulfoxide reductase